MIGLVELNFERKQQISRGYVVLFCMSPHWHVRRAAKCKGFRYSGLLGKDLRDIELRCEFKCSLNRSSSSK